MKVAWIPKDGTKETYHPKLGRLVAGVPIEMEATVAAPYLRAGLLTKVEKKPKPARRVNGTATDTTVTTDRADTTKKEA